MKLYVALLYCVLSCNLMAQTYWLKSPDEQSTITVEIGDEIIFNVNKAEKLTIPQAKIGLTLDEHQLGKNAEVQSAKTKKMTSQIQVPIPLKSKMIDDTYNQLVIRFKEGYSLEFRAYNAGIAYRLITHLKGEQLVVDEQLEVQFPEMATSYFPFEESTYSHYEQIFTYTKIDTISKGKFAALPILFQADDMKILFSEADLYDYPNLFFESMGKGRFRAKFPKAVAETKPQPGRRADRNVVITKEHPYIALTAGKRTYPWRVFIMTEEEKELIQQELVFLLSRGQQITSTDWIKPGKVAWDWYNANNLYNVAFKAGLNTKTYKYYIDFAAQYGIEYVILDEGWTKSTTEIRQFNPDIAVQELIDYGKKRGVGIILWCLWKPLDENMEEILDTYASWGAVGIKTDFMQRADQYMVNSYEKIAKACAERKLLVDFHGAYKPSGLRRAYPNVISYEGVHGNENNKWDNDVTPSHNLTLPFTRNAVGPMDYTPGAMRNAQSINHAIVFDRPISLGTRAHQAAMYVNFESALQMLCDSPSAYLADQKTVEMIAQIPTTWDQTRVLEAKIAEYLTIARKKGEDWYLGSMTDWSERDLNLDLSFLDADQTYEVHILKDGINANTYAEDYVVETRELTKDDTLSLHLAKGGGCLIIFRKK